MVPHLEQTYDLHDNSFTDMKQVMTKRDWERLALGPTKFQAFLARLRARIEVLIPVGYQDHTGFHFGVPANGI